MDRFSELTIFTRIADELSLTRAAEGLSMSVSGVSRHLGSLENRLGVRLVQRTTRHLSLTPEGERFAASAREILASVSEAEDSISRVSIEPRGVLRIGASLSFALIHLLPVIAAFRREHPQIRVDLQTANRYPDGMDGDLDLAIRTRRMEADSAVTIRKLAEIPRLMAASPAYLAARGLPKTPQDLSGHDLLLYTLAEDWETLPLRRGAETLRLGVSAALSANDGQVLRRAALDGAGILIQPAYVIDRDLAAGRLVPVLPEWELPRLVTNVVFPSRANLPARTRLFIDALAAHFRAESLETRWQALRLGQASESPKACSMSDGP